MKTEDKETKPHQKATPDVATRFVVERHNKTLEVRVSEASSTLEDGWTRYGDGATQTRPVCESAAAMLRLQDKMEATRKKGGVK